MPYKQARSTYNWCVGHQVQLTDGDKKYTKIDRQTGGLELGLVQGRDATDTK